MMGKYLFDGEDVGTDVPEESEATVPEIEVVAPDAEDILLEAGSGGVEGASQAFYIPAEIQAEMEAASSGPSIPLLLIIGFGAYLLTLAINPSLPSFSSSPRREKASTAGQRWMR